MASDSVLRNDGSFVLRNDGSNILRNGDDTNGVKLQGTHAISQIQDVSPRQKRRIREFKLTAIGKVSRVLTLTAYGQILKVFELFSKSRVSRVIESTIKGKITKLYENIRATSYVKINDEDWKQARKISEHLKEAKLNRLKNLYDEYKDLE